MSSTGHDAELGFLKRVADSSPLMLGYWCSELRCRYANGAYEEWFGVPPGELIGQHVTDVLGQDLYTLNEPYITAALGGIRQRFERVIVLPTGEARNTLTTYVPDVVDGTVQGFGVQVVDITPVKRAEAAWQSEAAANQRLLDQLKRSEQALRRAQRLGQIGSWEWEVDVDIVSWSDELYELFELDPTKLPPTYAEHAKLYEPRSWETLQIAVANTLSTGAPFCVELQFRTAKGRSGWLEGRGEAVKDEDGRVCSLIGTTQVITDRRALHQLRLERTRNAIALKERDAYMRSLSESMRTSLNGVLGLVHLLNDAALTPKQRGWLQSITSCGNQLEVLVKEMERPSRALVELCRTVPSALVRAGVAGALEASFDFLSDARYRAFFEQDGQFAGFLTLQGVLLEANAASLQAGGYIREEVIGLEFWKCGWFRLSEDVMRQVSDSVAVAADGTPTSHEVRYFVASGAERLARLTLFTVHDETGAARFIAATGVDITAQKAMEAKLVELADMAERMASVDRKKTEFLPIVAHELRNILAPIAMRLAVFEKRQNLAPNLLADVATMRRKRPANPS